MTKEEIRKQVEENYRLDCGIKDNYKFTGDENYLISKIVESQLQQNKEEEREFCNYLKQARKDFVTVTLEYCPNDNIKLRTEIDSILIAFDQALDRLTN